MLIAGTYRINKDANNIKNKGQIDAEGNGLQPYIVMVHRTQRELTIVKALKSSHKITCLNYGPFDNGHVLVGMDNGVIIAFNCIDMSKIC